MSFADPIRRNPRIPLDPRFPAVPTDLEPQGPGLALIHISEPTRPY